MSPTVHYLSPIGHGRRETDSSRRGPWSVVSERSGERPGPVPELPGTRSEVPRQKGPVVVVEDLGVPDFFLLRYYLSHSFGGEY